MMACVGLILGGVGTDHISGEYRFTYNLQILLDGLGLAPTVMGLFGFSEVLLNLESELRRDFVASQIGRLLPTLKDWAVSIWVIIRGTFLGFFLGILSGGGAIVASFACRPKRGLQRRRARCHSFGQINEGLVREKVVSKNEEQPDDFCGEQKVRCCRSTGG